MMLQRTAQFFGPVLALRNSRRMLEQIVGKTNLGALKSKDNYTFFTPLRNAVSSIKFRVTSSLNKFMFALESSINSISGDAKHPIDGYTKGDTEGGGGHSQDDVCRRP